MPSTAVVFLSVFFIWFLVESSAVGNVYTQYIYVTIPVPVIYYPVPQYMPPLHNNEKRLTSKNNEDASSEDPSFRDLLTTSSESTEDQSDAGGFMPTLGMNYPHPFFGEEFDPILNFIRRAPYRTMYPGSIYDRWKLKVPGQKWAVTEKPLITTESDEAVHDYEINNHPNWRYFDREFCGESIADRIIGGTEAVLGQYPWLALIGYKNRSTDSKTIFSCGATLINQCWVVSAAHCVTNLPSDYYIAIIRLGEHNLESKLDCDSTECADPVQDFVPVKIIRHENFNNPKLKHDISLLKLNRPAVITRWVQPICLPYNNILTENLLDKYGEVAGWGIENIDTLKTSKILQTIKLRVRTYDTCRKVYKQKAHIDEAQICVGGKVGLDSCNGDSGGPFMKVSVANGSTPKYFLYGIVSFGAEKCGKKPTPAVYTRVSRYMKWVLDHIEKC